MYPPEPHFVVLAEGEEGDPEERSYVAYTRTIRVTPKGEPLIEDFLPPLERFIDLIDAHTEPVGDTGFRVLDIYGGESLSRNQQRVLT